MPKEPVLVKLRNVSPLGDLELPTLRLVVKAGETFEVDKDTADLLLEQTGNYTLEG